MYYVRFKSGPESQEKRFKEAHKWYAISDKI